MNQEYQSIREKMQSYYDSGATLSYASRKAVLLKLRQTLKKWEEKLNEAVFLDLSKTTFENYETELGLTLSEITHTLRHLKKWMKPDRVSTPLAHFPSSSYILKQPKGVVLIMSPWNYPLLLSLTPLVAALSAGCCVVLKPSRYSENTSRVLKDMFDQLLEIRWDHIFFTGSPNVGKVVMQAAAKNLTPVTLELGGKSPCIVDGTTSLRTAAVRLAWGKFLNAGQTCVAPDYLLIDRKYKDAFIEELRKTADRMYPGGCKNKDLGKIINRKHFDRLSCLLEGQKIVYGGDKDEKTLKIAPTILDDVSPESPVMNEEIFGPVLPVLTYDNFDDAIQFIKKREKPLALYIFSKDKAHIKAVQDGITYGGGCVNDTVVHLSNPNMPFGGVGYSGIGSYHAKQGFDTFTHEKSTLRKALWLDIPVRYAPYNEKLVKVLKLLLK